MSSRQSVCGSREFGCLGARGTRRTRPDKIEGTLQLQHAVDSPAEQGVVCYNLTSNESWKFSPGEGCETRLSVRTLWIGGAGWLVNRVGYALFLIECSRYLPTRARVAARVFPDEGWKMDVECLTIPSRELR